MKKPNGTIQFVEATTAKPATFNLFETLVIDNPKTTVVFGTIKSKFLDHQKALLKEVRSNFLLWNVSNLCEMDIMLLIKKQKRIN